MPEKKYGLTLAQAQTANPTLYWRIVNHLHLDKSYNQWTVDEIAAYLDGGDHGGPPDPRSRAAYKSLGEWTARGSLGPKKK